VQSWNEFFEMGRFGLPDFSDADHEVSRITANWEYYSGNYLWIIGLFAAAAVISESQILLAVLLIAALYIICIGARTEPFKIGDAPLSWKQQYIAFAVVAVLVTYYFSGFLLLRYIAFALALVIIHSATRKRSVKSKVNFAIRANSTTSLTDSISRVADKIVNGSENVPVKETVKYDKNVYPSLRGKSTLAN